MGTITVVECVVDSTVEGFRLLHVAKTALPAFAEAAQEQIVSTTSASWGGALGQIVAFGGIRGGGVSTSETDAAATPLVHIRVEPKGTDTLELGRWCTTTLGTADITTYVVQWGSSWSVNRVPVSGVASGYLTGPLPSPNSANTWAWMSGWTKHNGIGDSFEGLLLTLGTGASPVPATPTTVAVGSDATNVDLNVLVSTMSHASLAVDWDTQSAATGVGLLTYTVDAAFGTETYGAGYTEGFRFGVHYASSSNTNPDYPSTTYRNLHTVGGPLTANRAATVGAITAWAQSVDTAPIVFSPALGTGGATITASQLFDPAVKDPCGCGQDSVEALPRPGQSTIPYRTTTWSQAKARMLGSLAGQQIVDGDHAGTRPLADLGTRETTDATNALIDSVAMVTDVLSFYQERVANEGYLRTARERMSMVQLGREIGYQLNPGVAASGWAAFTTFDTPTTPETIDVEAGTQLMSAPLAPREVPQVFETSSAITARKSHNALLPTLLQDQDLNALATSGGSELVFEGVSLALFAGDRFLLLSEAWPKTNEHVGEPTTFKVLQAASVTVDELRGTTAVTFHEDLKLSDNPADISNCRMFVLRAQGAAFGHDAPDFRAFHQDIQSGLPHTGTVGMSDAEWLGIDDVWTIVSPFTMPLNTVFRDVAAGSYMVEHRAGTTRLVAITKVETIGISGFALSRTVTRVSTTTDLGSESNPAGIRREAVYLLQSEELTVARIPKPEPVEGRTIVVQGQHPTLLPGQLISVTGATDDLSLRESEVITLDAVTPDALTDETTLTLGADLVGSYVRDTVTVNGNVAEITHGATYTETLGSGDTAIANQRFALTGSPLTYVTAPTPSGSMSTLELRASDVLWSEADSLFESKSNAEVYAIRSDEDNVSTVFFGDGERGARLPTGLQNITAIYRVGVGVGANVDAGRITIMQAPPPGIQTVINPVATVGGEDPESVDSARRNVPLTVLTLDRLVSVRDYQDFSRAFAGIGKARATLVAHAGRELMHITVLSADYAQVDPQDPLFANLVAALSEYGDPGAPVVVGSGPVAPFTVEAGVIVDPRHRVSTVLYNVEQALLSAYGVAAREYVAPVTAAEIAETAHTVPGVLGIDIDGFSDGAGSGLASVLVADDAYVGVDDNIVPAEILVLQESGITLTEKTS